MRVLVRSAVLAAFAALGCDRAQSLTRRWGERPTVAVAPSASASGPARAPRVDAGPRPAVPLDPKVRRSMKLAPLRTPAPGLAIGKGRIAVLTDDALVVRDTKKFEEVARIPVHAARGLVTMADGSFLTADPARTLWLLPGDERPRSFARLAMVPASTLFADRSTPDRFWVMSMLSSKLWSYVLGPSPVGLLVASEWIDLDGFDGRAFGSLRDGSFLYTTATGLRQFYGSGKKRAIEGAAGDAFRLLPGSRVDTVWLLGPERALLYRLLGGKLVKLRSISLSQMAYDAEADGRYLAVLELREPTDRPWSMTLEVFDVDGERHLKVAFTAPESFDEHAWLDVLTRNRRLALSARDKPLVAVGGPDELTVFLADQGTRIYPRS